ncbi:MULTISPECIES: c-type cytochrome [Pseudomonas]|uniref:Cytochrome c-551 n=6 Tax=Gammaproteobacteria TaxID=1236 RepID=A0A7Y1A8D8_PSEVE|nr:MULTISPECIES: c-type cytochrome [Pseudomonas]AUO47279.1 cytochrome C biogenesis protein CcsA [Pseudomonas ogarae]MBI6556073.1 c-type cytochrome [Pseudomonas veronii]MBI6653337.1 c-type cytochrome [Pseudomonas veronii]MCF4993861.1 c-type cytochrome [Pseudomonas gessardii]MCF5106335.1 c-type cytochrome [Pseudomonas gessardii]
MKKKLMHLFIFGTLLNLQPAQAVDGEALFKSKPCVGCHMIEARLVGPSYKEIAAKYAGQADASATLVKSIKEGSSGKWGAAPMPANQVTDEEAKTLADWILTLK